MKIRYYQQKDYFTYETFYTNLTVTTKQKSRAETWNIKKKKKKEEIDKNITENHQTKIADRNKRKRNNGDTEKPENKG